MQQALNEALGDFEDDEGHVEPQEAISLPDSQQMSESNTGLGPYWSQHSRPRPTSNSQKTLSYIGPHGDFQVHTGVPTPKFKKYDDKMIGNHELFSMYCYSMKLQAMKDMDWKTELKGPHRDQVIEAYETELDSLLNTILTPIPKGNPLYELRLSD